jgi:hypothetical protein
MIKVEVDSLDAYFNFDPERKKHLLGLDKVIRSSAPSLKRFFHAGTPTGEPGMRFKMIGYGQFRDPTKPDRGSRGAESPAAALRTRPAPA